jgi:hypothetical protein
MSSIAFRDEIASLYRDYLQESNDSEVLVLAKIKNIVESLLASIAHSQRFRYRGRYCRTTLLHSGIIPSEIRIPFCIILEIAGKVFEQTFDRVDFAPSFTGESNTGYEMSLQSMMNIRICQDALRIILGWFAKEVLREIPCEATSTELM